MKKRNISWLLACTFSTVLMAQEGKPLSLKVEVRGDYQRAYVEGKSQKNDCGFKGNIVDFVLKGDLSPKFSYAYRQRLNGINKDHTFFDATDWLYLNYKATKNVTLTAGKQIVWVGGWELEPAPIDVYFLSEYTYNFDCYQWGAAVTYGTSNGKDDITAQVCQSPFQKAYKTSHERDAEMYGYSILWNGKHGFFEPLWSVNLIEYAPSKYINYIALGNRFLLGNHVQIDLDLLNRAATGQAYFFRDCMIGGQFLYRPTEKLNIFVKASYDVNHSGTDADLCVKDGTEITRIGTGIEFFPLRDKNVRLHGNYCYSFGKNSNPNGVLQNKQSIFNVGVTWRVKVL